MSDVLMLFVLLGPVFATFGLIALLGRLGER